MRIYFLTLLLLSLLAFLGECPSAVSFDVVAALFDFSADFFIDLVGVTVFFLTLFSFPTVFTGSLFVVLVKKVKLPSLIAFVFLYGFPSLETLAFLLLILFFILLLLFYTQIYTIKIYRQKYVFKNISMNLYLSKKKCNFTKKK